MTLNFIPDDKLGDASESTSVSKMNILKPIFSGSSSAQKFQLGKMKASYIMCYGLVPFLTLNLLHIVKYRP